MRPVTLFVVSNLGVASHLPLTSAVTLTYLTIYSIIFAYNVPNDLGPGHQFGRIS